IPRPDFDRFVELCKTIKDVDCDFCIRDDSSNFYEHFIRMADKNSTFCISTAYDHVSGIYIEIAPLDGASKGNVKWNYKRFRLWEVLSHFTRFNFPKETKRRWLRQGKIPTLIAAWFASVFRKQLQPFATRQLENTLRKYPYEESEYVLYYTPVSSWERNMFKKEILDETMWVPFENIKARIPKHYHEYLTQIYGDYMTPPPEDRRDDGHIFKFVDMDKRYTIAEIKDLLNKNN
ncbi:MAG: LicD family protein, partial [Alphaproteobacteria bacterium]|nr:LicD family protein [Alphaproteobacteria bacterium]